MLAAIAAMRGSASMPEIAATIGVTVRSLKGWASRTGTSFARQPATRTTMRTIFTDNQLLMLKKLAANGHSATQIAGTIGRAFGITLDADAVRHKAKMLGVPLRRATGARILPIPISSATESALREAARDRAMSIERLASELLALLCTDRLIGAIMDDAAPKAVKKNPHDADSFRAKPNGAPVNAPTSG